MLSKGTIYNLGVRLKNFGERMAHVKLLGVPLFRWCCDPVRDLGLALMDSVYSTPIRDM